MKAGSALFTVRNCREADTDAVSDLMAQLGYSVSAGEVLDRVKGIRNIGGEVFVAVGKDGKVVGSVQAIRELRLAEGEFAELVSLVVDDDCRKMGIGGMLIRTVEKWCMDQRIECLRIRCNNKRSGALRFYTKAGFVQKKEQAILEKYF